MMFSTTPPPPDSDAHSDQSGWSISSASSIAVALFLNNNLYIDGDPVVNSIDVHSRSERSLSSDDNMSINVGFRHELLDELRDELLEKLKTLTEPGRFKKSEVGIIAKIPFNDFNRLYGGETIQKVVCGVLEELASCCKKDSDCERALRTSAKNIAALDFSAAEEYGTAWKEQATTANRGAFKP